MASLFKQYCESLSESEKVKFFDTVYNLYIVENLASHKVAEIMQLDYNIIRGVIFNNKDPRFQKSKEQVNNRERLYNFTCLLCGKQFMSKSPKLKICEDCLKPIDLPCSCCGKPVTLTRKKMIKYRKGELSNDSIVCSTKCHNEKIRLNGFKKTCPVCNKPFNTHKQAQVYCDDCLSPKESVCPICNKTFMPTYHQMIKKLNGIPIYCSNSCTIKLSLKTYEQRTGYSNMSYNPEVIEKRKQTYREKTGYDSPLENPDVRNEIKENLMKKSGVPYACMLKQCRVSSGAFSKINQKYFEYFECDDYEFHIGKSSFDLKKGNILIEIDPTYTHSSTTVNRWGETKDKNYQFNKTKLAKDNGYNCIHIFDWDDTYKIKNIILPKSNKIYAKDCIIKSVAREETNDFLNKYHLQNTVRNQSVRLGLYYNEELIQLMTFGKPRYNKNYEWELLRLCSKFDYIVVGGAEKLFKYFINEYKPTTIISYCDNSKFSGDVYVRVGMSLKSKGTPTIHWYNINTRQHITDGELLRNGFDRLVGSKLSPPQIYGKGTDNKQLMVEHNFYGVYDCGQSSYEWKCSEVK